jgi:hypothetical protein
LRRITVGRDERVRTASERVALLDVEGLSNESPLVIQARHDAAFDVEAVTKEFFRTFVDVHRALREEIEKSNPTFKEQAGEHALIILNRLMFLYFIQKKGWLDGKADYLYERFRQFYRDDPDGDSFYSKFLLRVFRALSDKNFARGDLGDVPFLNGGLFEVDPNRSQVPFNLKVSNRVFRRVFDDLLEHYNFTVREDTPLDIEVAIDPEMLGKVFENLVLGMEAGEDLRHRMGAYYTPRSVVHFMCQQALLTHLTEEGSVERSKLDTLLTLNPPDQLTPEDVEILNRTLTVSECRPLRDLTLKARVVDPAVGSGAFPVGMLHAMVDVVKYLDVRLHGQGYITRRNYDYELKRHIIENCLYGVDIMEPAVRICELRLWLSLTVDYQRQDSEAVPALPNLSYRIVEGDSLIGKLLGRPVRLPRDLTIPRYRALVKEIENEKHAFFDEPNLAGKRTKEIAIVAKQAELAALLLRVQKEKAQGDFDNRFGGLYGDAHLTKKERLERDALAEEIATLNKLIVEAQNAQKKAEAVLAGKLSAKAAGLEDGNCRLRETFLWELDFAEVFREKGGFDIAIANPPWVRQEQIKEQKAHYQREFPHCYTGTADLYVFFYERGFSLLRNGGVFCYISSNKFFRAGYGENLRKFLTERTTLHTVIDFGDLPLFEATTYPCIVLAVLRNGTASVPYNESHAVRALNVPSMDVIDRLPQQVADHAFALPQKRLSANGWALESPAVLNLLDRIKSKGTPLGEYVQGKIYRGIVTGLNEAFVIDEATRKRLIREDPKSAEIIKPWLRGRDIDRWRADHQGRYLLLVKVGTNMKRYPAVLEHLSPFRKELANRWEPKHGQCEWYELRSCDYYDAFEEHKIIYPDIAVHSEFAFDRERCYGGNTLYIIPTDDLYLLGLLNSLLIEFCYCHITSTIQGGFMRFIYQYMQHLPIAPAAPAERQAIEERVEKLLACRGEGSLVRAWEREIDEIVYRVYGLSKEEVKVIEEWAEGRGKG